MAGFLLSDKRRRTDERTGWSGPVVITWTISGRFPEHPWSASKSSHAARRQRQSSAVVSTRLTMPNVGCEARIRWVLGRHQTSKDASLRETSDFRWTPQAGSRASPKWQSEPGGTGRNVKTAPDLLQTRRQWRLGRDRLAMRARIVLPLAVRQESQGLCAEGPEAVCVRHP